MWLPTKKCFLPLRSPGGCRLRGEIEVAEFDKFGVSVEKKYCGRETEPPAASKLVPWEIETDGARDRKWWRGETETGGVGSEAGNA